MKKYMKEIVDLGAPVSPKLGKCSPRFRRKILHIVQKIDVISYDNGEEDEFKDQEKKRKNSLKELLVIPTLRAKRRSFSLKLQLCTAAEERKVKSKESSLSFSMQIEEGIKMEKISLMDSGREREKGEISKPEKFFTLEKIPTILINKNCNQRKDSGHSSSPRRDSGDLDALPNSTRKPSFKDTSEEIPEINIKKASDQRKDSGDSSGRKDSGEFQNFTGKPSLKDEVLGFEFSSFNLMSGAMVEESDNY